MRPVGTILVVEDTYESRKLLSDILTREGYEVRPADSGELALSAVAAKAPGLILLDIQMPGMDGFEVLRLLRADDQTRDIPVIFLSAATDKTTVVRGLKLGAVDFVSKPFQEEELLARVRTHMELSALRQRLEDSARELNQLFESMREGFAVHEIVLEDGVACDYRFLQVNSAFEEMTGLSRDDIVGRTVLDVLPGTEPSWIERYGQVALTGVPAHFESRAVDLGRTYEVRAYSPQHGIFATVFSDITDRRESEEALRQLNESLEQRVDQRTSELNRSVVELEQALAAKDLFLAGMSHELRTPLNSIIGFSGIMESGGAGELPAEAHKQIGLVHASGRQLLGLVDTLPDSASVEAGPLELVIAPFDLAELLAGVESTMRPQVERAGLEFVLRAPADRIEIVSDDGRVREVLLDLIENAVKFTQRGSVALDATVDDGRVRFAVADTGVGIAPEDIDVIQEPFRQLSQAGVAKTTGAGLGLAICARIAEALGGEITVESEVGAGSTFTLTLPREPARAD